MSKENFFKQDTLVDVTPLQTKIELPKQIGPYPIESLLQEGGMSYLYLGINPDNHEPLAIKVLKKEFLSHKELEDRFLKESEIIALTNHPNIVKLYGQGMWEEGLYIAMEFIRGISLRNMILQNSLTIKRSLDVVLQIAYALFHLHAHGVIHRDLKPENILLTDSGGVKVIDFGISQLHEEEKEHDVKSKVLGTPVYMSPEQKLDPSTAGYSSDIYSLGIITYELVLGKLSHGVIHLSLLPRELQKILKKALSPKVEDRYQDIAEFITDLTNYLESEKFTNDIGKSDFTSTLFEEIKQGQRLLSAKLTENDKLDIGLISSTHLGLTTTYYDFISINDGSIVCILVESSQTDASNILYTTLFKGITLAMQDSLNEPKKMVTAVNKIICKQFEDIFFNLNIVVLNPIKHQLKFLSCGFGSLWHMPLGLSEVRKLTTDNIALGISEEIEFIEIQSNWNIGDRIVLHNFRAVKSTLDKEDTGLSEEAFQEALKDTLYLSPQKQVDAILRKMTPASETSLVDKPTTLISISRKA